MKGVGLHELNCLKVKVEGAGGRSVLESTDDSGFCMDWMSENNLGMTLAISLATREANFRLELELFFELERRLPDPYNIE